MQILNSKLPQKTWDVLLWFKLNTLVHKHKCSCVTVNKCICTICSVFELNKLSLIKMNFLKLIFSFWFVTALILSRKLSVNIIGGEYGVLVAGYSKHSCMEKRFNCVQSL